MRFRLAALALVAVALVTGISSHRRHSSCSGAATRLFLAGAKKAHPPEAAVQADVGTVTSDCHDSSRLAAVSGALMAGGRDVQAARVAERAVALAPRDYVAWLAVANAEADSDPARARAAQREVRTLNPRRMARPPARRPSARPPSASQALAALARSVGAGP